MQLLNIADAQLLNIADAQLLNIADVQLLNIADAQLLNIAVTYHKTAVTSLNIAALYLNVAAA